MLARRDEVGTRDGRAAQGRQPPSLSLRLVSFSAGPLCISRVAPVPQLPASGPFEDGVKQAHTAEPPIAEAAAT